MFNALNVFHWLRPRQDGLLCADDIFRCDFFNENAFILIRISQYIGSNPYIAIKNDFAIAMDHIHNGNTISVTENDP